MKFIDLTHTFTSNTPVFPGDPKPSLEQVSYLEKDTFNDHKLSTVMHVGTHMDAPLHMIEKGATIDALDVDRFIGRGVLINAQYKKVVDASILEGYTINAGDIVLLYTGLSSKYYDESYFTDFPVITESFTEALIERNIYLLGMDMSGPDSDQPWPIHKALLGNNICIVENLTNLALLEGKNIFEVIALPIKLQSDAAPVRVIARIID